MLPRCILIGKLKGIGRGISKKSAEQEAAKMPFPVCAHESHVSLGHPRSAHLILRVARKSPTRWLSRAAGRYYRIEGQREIRPVMELNGLLDSGYTM